MPSKKVFLIVGLGNYIHASYRLFRQVKDIPLKIEVVVINEEKLIQILSKENIACDYLNSSNRGFGFWMWKPVVIDFYLKSYDQVIYIDAGSEIVTSQFFNLMNWFDFNSFNMILSPSGQRMKSYTKMDAVLQFYNDNEWKNLQELPMFQAGVLFLKKSPGNVKLFKELTDLVKENRVDLFDDINRTNSNEDYFIEHRHDQSVFNLILYKYFDFNEATLFPSSLTPPGQNIGFNSLPAVLCLRNISFLSYSNNYSIFGEQIKFPLFLKIVSRLFNLLFKKFKVSHYLVDFLFNRICLLWASFFYKELFLKFKENFNSKENYNNWPKLSDFIISK